MPAIGNRLIKTCVMCMGLCALRPSFGGIALFDAIAMAESTNGRRSGNVYQITPEYVSDVNRIQRKLTRVDGMKRERFSCESVFDREASERMMEVFWNYYCPRVGDWSDETKCKLHHVGYRGLRTKKDLAEIYWKKIRKFNKSR
ncbi:MAG: hypothetical protein MJZ81_10765 [Bacteroidales bacterium]|nr:hypothetical protein [Bacteroidales bacterium]